MLGFVKNFYLIKKQKKVGMSQRSVHIKSYMIKKIFKKQPSSFWWFLSGTSCIHQDTFNDSPDGNFEALWKIIDEHYCFLEYKNQEYGLDWNKIHADYKKRLTSGMSNEQLFDVLSEMLNELRDGHVNLVSKDRTSQ